MVYVRLNPVTSGGIATKAWADQADLNFEAVKPRILQPVALRGTGTVILNSDYYIHVTHLVGDGTSDGGLVWEFLIPDDFVTLTKARLRCWTNVASGNLRYDAGAYWGVPGESEGAHSASVPLTTLAVPANQIVEIDVAAALTGVVPNASLALGFNRYGSSALDTLGAELGIFVATDIRYTP